MATATASPHAGAGRTWLRGHPGEQSSGPRAGAPKGAHPARSTASRAAAQGLSRSRVAQRRPLCVSQKRAKPARERALEPAVSCGVVARRPRPRDRASRGGGWSFLVAGGTGRNPTETTQELTETGVRSARPETVVGERPRERSGGVNLSHGVLVARQRAAAAREVNWLILPVVICLSQRLSHACLSTRQIRW